MSILFRRSPIPAPAGLMSTGVDSRRQSDCAKGAMRGGRP
jgi:hypothetical protein